MSDFLSKFGEDLKNNVSGFIAVSVTEVTALVADDAFDLEASFSKNK